MNQSYSLQGHQLLVSLITPTKIFSLRLYNMQAMRVTSQLLKAVYQRYLNLIVLRSLARLPRWLAEFVHPSCDIHLNIQHFHIISHATYCSIILNSAMLTP